MYEEAYLASTVPFATMAAIGSMASMTTSSIQLGSARVCAA